MSPSNKAYFFISHIPYNRWSPYYTDPLGFKTILVKRKGGKSIMNEGRWAVTTGSMVMGVAPPSGQKFKSPFASSM